MRDRRKRRSVPTSGDERAAGPDLVLGLALAIARLHTDKSVECAAAYRESDEEASSAWQADPEFGNALHLAYQMGETKPLRDFVKAGKSVPQAHVFVAGELIPMRSSWPTCSATITSNKSSDRGRTAWQAKRQPPRKQSATLRGWWRSRRKAGSSATGANGCRAS